MRRLSRGWRRLALLPLLLLLLPQMHRPRVAHAAPAVTATIRVRHALDCDSLRERTRKHE